MTKKLYVYEVHTKDKAYQIVASSYSQTSSGLVFWDITGNVEVGFVPYTSLEIVKIISDKDDKQT